MSEAIPSQIYATWSVADLDWLHDDQGIGEDWRASTKRAELLMAERRKERVAEEGAA